MSENEKPRLQAATLATLKVVRKADFGVFLDGGTGQTSDDVLLHQGQQSRPVEIGEEVDVFLYHDARGRITASMKLPKMKEGQVARAEVIHFTGKQGAFVDLGAERAVFMPFSRMRGRVYEGEKVWVKLYTDKTGRLAVTMEVEEDLQRAALPFTGKVGDKLKGTVYNETDEGYFLFAEGRHVAFLHRSEMAGAALRMGQEIDFRVAFIRPDGRINVSLRPQKEDALFEDGERILQFLQERGGKMPYGDATSPEIIQTKFGMSKAAFKRALGRLLRQGTIRQEDGWTWFCEETEENKEN